MSTSPSPPGLTRTSRWVRISGWVVAAAVLLVFPSVVTDPTYTSIGVFTLIFMTCATAWNGFSGFSGYISLGNGVFYGTGAYTLTLIALHLNMAGGWLIFALVPVAGVAAALVAIPFGLLALRTRRHTFVVISIAVFFVFQLLAFNFGFTGGSAGLIPPVPSWAGATYNNPFYYVAFGLLVFTVLLFLGVRHSRFGLQLLAIRDDEDRARGLGVKAFRVKLTDFVLCGFVTGMGGAVFAYFVGQIYPQFAYDPVFDVTVSLMTFLGGLGTVAGPLLGAIVLEPVSQIMTIDYSAQSAYLVLDGALFLLVIFFMPRGLIPTVSSWLRTLEVRRMRHRKAAADKAVAVPGDRGEESLVSRGEMS